MDPKDLNSLWQCFVEGGSLNFPKPTQKVHVGIWHILKAQTSSHIPTLRPKYLPYSYMDLLAHQTERPKSRILSPQLPKSRAVGPETDTKHSPKPQTGVGLRVGSPESYCTLLGGTWEILATYDWAYNRTYNPSK